MHNLHAVAYRSNAIIPAYLGFVIHLLLPTQSPLTYSRRQTSGSKQIELLDDVATKKKKKKKKKKVNDLKCVLKPTKSRLSLTQHANKSSRWAE